MKTVKVLICILLIAVMSLVSVCAFADGFKIGRVNTDNVIVANKEYTEMLGHLNKGVRVLYWECGSENLVGIAIQNGKIGYCYRGYISEVSEIGAGEVLKTKHEAAVYTVNKAGSPVLYCSVPAGIPLVLSAVNGEWAKVKNLKGQVGYMKLADLKVVA